MGRFPLRGLSFFVFVAALVPSISAQQPRLLPFQRFGVIADNVGAANFAVADLNGDGTNEILSCSNGAPFAVTRRGASTWTTSWMGPHIRCVGLAVGDRDGDGGYDVLVTTSDSPGKFAILDPRSLGPPKVTVTLPGSVAGTDIAIGNVDSDPVNEIIVLTSANVYVYNAATLALKWTGQGYGGSKVRLGDVDGDGRNDIVINGSSGWVLDGQSQSLKFGYYGGFGTAMAVGDVDADSKAEIVFAAAWSQNVTILNGDTLQTTTVQGTNSPYTQTIAIGDANADGSAEIVTGNNQWGDIEGRRPSDGVRLWNINNPEHGTMGIALGDVTGEGKPEVIWGAGASSSGTDALFIGDPVSKTIKWESADLDGSFVSATGDIDGDGRTEYVVCSLSSDSGYQGSVIEVFDALTGASEGVMLAGTANFDGGKIAIGQLDADPALEVVIAGGSWYSSQFLVFDGATHLQEFASAATPCCSAPSLISTTLTVANIDGDSVDEIILGESDSKIIVFNGASNIIQMSFPVDGYVNDLAIADIDSNGVKDLVVGTSSKLSVYNTSNWSPTSVALSDVRKVAADYGYVAATTSDGSVRTYTGINLAALWTCTSANLGTSSTSGALAFGTLGGSTRLFAGGGDGNVRMLPLTGATCPAFSTTSVSQYGIVALKAVDATHDGRIDLIVDTWLSSEIDLLGLSTDTPGDADNDAAVGGNDIDAITDFIMGHPGLAPAGDSNGDVRVGAEDAFQIINYVYGGGPAPAP